jgi:cytochrome bd-type quinol oxidase subunit 1
MRSACRQATQPKVLWVRPQAHTAAEKLLFILLSLAAVTGIVYGVSCLFDLVQNWAAFSTGIRNFI